MAAGAIGVCCQKVGEAEAMVYGGVPNVLVSNQIVGTGKIARLVALAKQAWVAVCADHPANVQSLNEAALAFGVRLPVPLLNLPEVHRSLLCVCLAALI